MHDWSGIAVRFAVFAALALLFGMPLQSLAAPRNAMVPRAAWPVLAGAAIVASILGLLMLVGAMAGTAMLPPDGEVLRIVLFDTAMGTAFLVRIAALVLALGIAGMARRRARPIGLVVTAGVALATLAWTGHGAMDEGARGTVHLVADIVHLLAAGAWIGAIAAMLVAFAGRADDSCAALEHFASTGTVLVAVLLLTGVVNGAMILGPAGLPTIGETLYGRLLIAKLVLFCGMLGMAALNRWRLTPRLKAAIAAGDTGRPVTALRASLSVELLLGFGILALVGWLGTLSPDG